MQYLRVLPDLSAFVPPSRVPPGAALIAAWHRSVVAAVVLVDEGNAWLGHYRWSFVTAKGEIRFPRAIMRGKAVTLPHVVLATASLGREVVEHAILAGDWETLAPEGYVLTMSGEHLDCRRGNLHTLVGVKRKENMVAVPSDLGLVREPREVYVPPDGDRAALAVSRGFSEDGTLQPSAGHVQEPAPRAQSGPPGPSVWELLETLETPPVPTTAPHGSPADGPATSGREGSGGAP